MAETSLNSSCRTHPTETANVESYRTVLIEDAKDKKKWSSTKGLKVDSYENKMRQVFFMAEMFFQTRSADGLQALKNEIEELEQQTKDRGSSSCKGIEAFYDNEAFTTEDCEMMLATFKTAYGDTFGDLNVQLVTNIRESLIRQKLQRHVLRNKLPLTLQILCKELTANDIENDAVVDHTVKTLINHMVQMEDWEVQLSTKLTESLTTETAPDMARIFIRFLDALSSEAADVRRYTDEMVKLYGGVQEWPSLEALMTAIGNTVDRETFKIRVVQLFAICVSQVAAKNLAWVTSVETLIKLMGTRLGRFN